MIFVLSIRLILYIGVVGCAERNTCSLSTFWRYNEYYGTYGIVSSATTVMIINEKLCWELIFISFSEQRTGMANRIHVSPDTANLLIEGGKRHWITKREDVVTIRGKTDIISYWIKCENITIPKESSDDNSVTDSDLDGSQSRDRFERLIEWNVGILVHLIKEIVANRESQYMETRASTRNLQWDKEAASIAGATENPLSEVVEIITLPEFKRTLANRTSSDIEIDKQVVQELREYVSCVASMYRPNAFHNFEHASHGKNNFFLSLLLFQE